MKYYHFQVKLLCSPEYGKELHKLIRDEENKGGIETIRKVELSAPPEDLIKAIISITADSLNIIFILWTFWNSIKKKPGSKLIITTDTEQFDFDTRDINEIQLLLGEPLTQLYSCACHVPSLSKKELSDSAYLLSFRQIIYKNNILPRINHVKFAKYNDVDNSIEATVQIGNGEINELFDNGVPLYVNPIVIRQFIGSPQEQIMITGLNLSLTTSKGAGKLEELIL
ncbi:hypothetical protein E4H04_02900 [Candidatus Bathyarchaeota archaeon]|nr:MAG: hypothetical protein E4H04_02900 [Candidatus Bathyarchaeota archaeon]